MVWPLQALRNTWKSLWSCNQEQDITEAGTYRHPGLSRAQLGYEDRSLSLPPYVMAAALHRTVDFWYHLPLPRETGRSPLFISACTSSWDLKHGHSRRPPKGGQRRKGTSCLTPSISSLPTSHGNIMHPVLIITVHINEWNNLLEQWASMISWPPGVFY